MVNNEIWLDSHANVGIIPEQNIYLGAFVSQSTSGNQTTLTLNATFTGNFTLVANLYRGCTLDIYSTSDVLTDRTMIQSNTATTLTVSNSLATAITDTPTGYYGVIHHYGAPVPAPKGTAAGSTYVAQVLNLQFLSDDPANYDDESITIHRVPTANGTTSTAYVLGLDQSGAYAGATAALEIDISDPQLSSAEEIIDVIVGAIAAEDLDFTVARSGDSLVITNVYGGACSASSVSDATYLTLTTTTVGVTNTSNNARLLADSWTGLATSVTIPATSTEPKQINIGIGGTRNHTYQFKGAETTSEFSLDAMANSFPWLYYALGSATVSGGNPGVATAPSADGMTFGSSTGFLYRSSSLAGDNLIHRVIDGAVSPPFNGTANAQLLGDDTTALTYTITENNSSDLPSFAVEYTLRKPDVTFSDVTPAVVDSAKEQVYTKIFPGCTVNSLTLTAAVGQELTCNVSAMPKNTFVAPVNYEPQNAVPDVADFVNFGTRLGETTDASGCEGRMRPFFFSDGRIKLFGEEFIQLENMTLTIENGVQQKRFIGSYDKRSQFAFAGQRNYNLTFTGLVTDAALFDYFRQEHAFSLNGASAGSEVDLLFTKENGESLVLKFEDYHVTVAEFPLTNDNGPLMVNWTIVPLALKECSLTTYWAIQG